MTEPEPSESLSKADIGIVSALPIELSPFVGRCARVRKYSGGRFVFRGGTYEDIRIVFAESGMGFASARQASLSLIEAHSPKWLLSCGFSGALQPGMKIGDIVVADEIVDTHGQSLSVPVNMSSESRQSLHVGRLLTADSMVRKVSEKQQLADTSAALAVDMESLAVAQVGRETKTRFMAVRVISDDMSADLPPEIASLISSSGSLRLGAAVGAIWKRPDSIKEMWRLRENAVQAAQRLAIFLDGIVKQLNASGQ